RRNHRRAPTPEIKEVREQSDQPQQCQRHIRTQHSDDDCQQRNRQHPPGGREVPQLLVARFSVFCLHPNRSVSPRRIKISLIWTRSPVVGGETPPRPQRMGRFIEGSAQSGGIPASSTRSTPTPTPPSLSSKKPV